MPLPECYNEFDFSTANVQFWLFKKSYSGRELRYSGRWIDTDENLKTALRTAVKERLDLIGEVEEYGLLSRVDENVGLSIDTDETYVDRIISASANPTNNNKIRSIKDINNTSFYVAKLIANDVVLYAVKKVGSAWSTKKKTSFISIFYSDDILALNANPDFSISKYFDFFLCGEKIIISDKNSFESILNYKVAHEDDFISLQREADFANIFSTLEPLVSFVGSNKLHLRRVCSIRQKGHYRNVEFMQRLQSNHRVCGLNIDFDQEGRIVPSLATCPDILRALLDHRLNSMFSGVVYDVPDATAIS